MTGKQQRFVLAYLGEAKSNATKAARMAGYKNSEIGRQLLRNVTIRRAIDEALADRVLTKDEILDELTSIAKGSIDDLADCFDVVEGRRVLNLHKVREAGVGHLIKSVVPTKHGDSLVLADRVRALELLGKYRQLFREQLDLNIGLDLDSLSNEQLAAVAAGRYEAIAALAVRGSIEA